MSLEDSIQDDDECIVFDGLSVLVEKNFYRNSGDKIRIDFVEGQGITVELKN